MSGVVEGEGRRCRGVDNKIYRIACFLFYSTMIIDDYDYDYEFHICCLYNTRLYLRIHDLLYTIS